MCQAARARARARARGFAFAIALAAVAAAAAPPLLADERPASPPVEADPAWLEAKVAEAEARLGRGDALGAIKLAEALLIVEPDMPKPHRERLVVLKVRAEEEVVRTSVIRAHLSAAKLLVAPDEPVELTLFVTNIADEPVTLGIDPDVSEIFGALDVEVEAIAADGSRGLRRETRRLWDVRRAVTLAPQESWETRVTVPPAVEPGQALPGILDRPVFRRMTVSGRLRPYFLEKGGEPSYGRFLPILAVEVYPIDAAYHGIAADPLRTVRDALAELAARDLDPRERRALEDRLFLGALLAPPGPAEDEVVRLLEKALPAPDTPVTGSRAAAGASGPPALPIMVALAGIAREPLEPADPARWRAWARRRLR